jgi:hypothetical protein
MLYAIEYAPAALRDLERLDPFICKKLIADIEKLAGNRVRTVLNNSTPKKSFSESRLDQERTTA